VCDLAFVPKPFHLDLESERERYLMHENDPDDPRYRAFLAQLWTVLKPLLRPGSNGLDYGSGPGPALVAIAREDGFEMTAYDPHFAPNVSSLDRTYDFVTCTETAEHFASPAEEFARLTGLLEPDGILGVMTSMLDDRSAFPSWHYLRDPTHLAFYSSTTMLWIAERHGRHISFPTGNVAVFT
tara:strand:- start:2977 stop:3525 length:549 start_codon:yes stop_codon:yes gene_type:complete